MNKMATRICQHTLTAKELNALIKRHTVAG